ncbi:MAG: pilus assembly protein PilM [Elusimicrobiales bacterium]|nr:pilus assembly protein PilM [Elusimicrobiales bacterium]
MALLDQVMGKSRLRNCLGIYISIEDICIVETRMDGGSVKIDRYVKVPVPQVKKAAGEVRNAAMNADFFASETNWLTHLQKALGQVKWGTRNAVITLSPQFAVFRHFLMPVIERRFWRQSVPLEAKKYVPFPFETSVYDFQVYQLGAEGAKDKMGVLFALTNAKVSEALTAGIRKIGLEPVGIEVSATSVGRVFGHVTGAGPRLFTHFDSTTAYMLLSNNGVPLLSREVTFGDVQASERRRLDVKGSIEFVNKQMGSQTPQLFKEVHMSGENLDLWKVVVEDDAKLPIKTWDPRQVLRLPEGDWCIYAAAGAALRQIIADGGVDLVSKTSESVDEQRALFFVWSAGLALAALVFLSALAGQVQYRFKSFELSRLRASNPEVPEFAGLQPQMIQQKVDDMQASANRLLAITSRQDYFTPKFVAVLNTLPAKIWLTSLNFVSRTTIGQTTQFESDLTLNGFVRAGNSKTDLELVQSFRDSLKANPEIEKTYGGRVNLNFNAATGKGGSGGRPDDTSFTINCSLSQGGR